MASFADETRTDGTRLNKYLAERGLCSRRGADQLIRDGRVRINGKRAGLGEVVGEDDVVQLDGRVVSEQRPQARYIALNKPVGIVCTTDRDEPRNIVDYLGFDERIFPIGRLDADSEGLILLTNDGDIVNLILRARYGHEKAYDVWVDKPLTEAFLERMRTGVPILDTVTQPARVRQVGNRRFHIVLTQGLNRQIRRMCEALGYRVTRLRRQRVMHIRLGQLPVGQWRELSRGERRELFRLLEQAQAQDARRRADEADDGL